MPIKKDLFNTQICSPKYMQNCVVDVLKDVAELKDITGFVLYAYD
jgi:hypothetical protein